MLLASFKCDTCLRCLCVEDEVTKHVNDRMLSDKWSRRFAIVMIAGSQFKVTTEDVIVVRNSFYPTIGDRIRLEKVMLVGDSDFSLVGKPLVRSVDTHTRFCVVFRRKYILLSIIVNS